MIEHSSRLPAAVRLGLLLLLAAALPGCGPEGGADAGPAPGAAEAPAPAAAPEPSPEAAPAARRPMIKAVHYFSSHWPPNFWGSFEKSAVDQELAQIRADGFDTVLLVLPWLGFELGLDDASSEPGPLYERLEWMLGRIAAQDLGFGIRVGFPHNFDPAKGIGGWDLCRRLFAEEAFRAAWRAYLGRVSKAIDPWRERLVMAFFSWEDFFCPFGLFPYLPGEDRLELARASGYQQWLGERYELDLVRFLYLREFDALAQVPFPQRDRPAMWLYYRFIDHFFRTELLEPGEAVLPELSMEVRVDKDWIPMGERRYWTPHDHLLGDDDLRGSYWAPFFGAKNEGELLSAEEALKNFAYMLRNVTGDGQDTGHVVEQFNFVDNTPEYVGRHAEIAAEALPAFLEGAAELLQRHSAGYGLWAYRNYADNALYNSSFELGLRGWDVTGEAATFENADGDQAVALGDGARIAQRMFPYHHFVSLRLAETMHFCARFEAGSEGALELAVEGAPVASLEAGASPLSCTTTAADPFDIEAEVTLAITARGPVRVDDLRLHWFVQDLGVYELDGSPGPNLPLIRQLNEVWLERELPPEADPQAQPPAAPTD